MQDLPVATTLDDLLLPSAGEEFGDIFDACDLVDGGAVDWIPERLAGQDHGTYEGLPEGNHSAGSSGASGAPVRTASGSEPHEPANPPASTAFGAPAAPQPSSKPTRATGAGRSPTPQQLKAQTRKEKNKQSAVRSRQRRQAQERAQNDKIRQLAEAARQLQVAVMALSHENAALKQMLSAHGVQLPAAPYAPQMSPVSAPASAAHNFHNFSAPAAQFPQPFAGSMPMCGSLPMPVLPATDAAGTPTTSGPSRPMHGSSTASPTVGCDSAPAAQQQAAGSPGTAGTVGRGQRNLLRTAAGVAATCVGLACMLAQVPGPALSGQAAHSTRRQLLQLAPPEAARAAPEPAGVRPDVNSSALALRTLGGLAEELLALPPGAPDLQRSESLILREHRAAAARSEEGERLRAYDGGRKAGTALALHDPSQGVVAHRLGDDRRVEGRKWVNLAPLRSVTLQQLAGDALDGAGLVRPDSCRPVMSFAAGDRAKAADASEARVVRVAEHDDADKDADGDAWEPLRDEAPGAEPEVPGGPTGAVSIVFPRPARGQGDESDTLQQVDRVFVVMAENDPVSRYTTYACELAQPVFM
ncbi:unnamed protein product [Pedinophyceae sp. YPF-701]|nr:unnamed protein product [Pedinophyceae sp. YPF-701]